MDDKFRKYLQYIYSFIPYILSFFSPEILQMNTVHSNYSKIEMFLTLQQIILKNLHTMHKHTFLHEPKILYYNSNYKYIVG